MMRTVGAPAVRFVRTAMLAAAAVIAVACGREPTGASGGFARTTLEFGPAFQAGPGTSAGDEVSRIEITVYLVNPALPVGSSGRRRVLTTLKLDPNDTKRVVETDDAITITVDFQLQGANSVYEIDGAAYDAAGTLLYQVPPVQFTESQVGSNSGVTVNGTAIYVGPGANAARIDVSPPSLSLNPGEQATLTAAAFTAANAPIAKAPFRWRSLNSQVAVFPDERSGVIRAVGQGSTQVIVSIEGIQVTGSAQVTVALTPTALQLVSGGGQSAQTGAALPNPVVVRLVANGIPVPGATVNFSLTGSGAGSLSASSVTTGANGEAQARWTLGSAAGTQTLVASSPGVPNLSVSATATAPPTAINIVSILQGGSPANLSAIRTGASITVTALVTQGGQPLAGATVAFGAGNASPGFSPTTATTNSSGQASAAFSSGSAGTFTITVTVPGGSGGVASAQTNVTVLNPAVVTQLVKVSGDNQTVKIGTTFKDPIVVEARNAFGEPVPNVALEFVVSGGTSTFNTLSDGRVSLVLGVPVGAVAGAASITARVASNPSISVTFSFSAVP